MKKTKWIPILSFLLLFTLLLGGCSTPSNPNVNTEITESNTPENTSPNDPPPAIENARSLSIGGVDISQYRIVYAQSPLYTKIGSNTGKTVGGGYRHLPTWKQPSLRF